MKIYKYTINKRLVGKEQSIDIPIPRMFYNIEFYNDEITLWYGVNDDKNAIQQTLTYIVLHTGDEVPNDLIFCKTVIDHKCGLVYHVFIRYK